ncbi:MULTISPECIES: mannitol dehydrogenase family protein [Sphingomonas]|jgi:tagaturonate reductase|uniref:Mannitol dehydrogenase family protein n=1 Tax=Sphingomonas zeae TaxID=1646122 RepID=A0A7Y6B7P7_9SPHN|nr:MULTISPECIES: mannitol dehydrogenase family protein [Sphingomonas]MBB4048552.1 tagaturonate reductase [Sphingomonas zeae]MDK8186554.1 mannitol dehydrogenase family protein [Sphingomonas zeae]MDK8216213.1 mannitol dehydrogenase family protein [Sphingomonas sp. UMB7805-LC452B]NUU48016.1 mannitol dehydrogenase family protein [Sphingomonas zeae]
MSEAPVILQFGTSRFLQAHVDLFAEEARTGGQVVPPIAIVQTTRDPERARRLAGFADPAGFPVILRGLRDGQRDERTVQVRSVREGLSAAGDWDRLVELAVGAATHIVSNTGDSGYAIPDDDRTAPAKGQVPASFCGMLTELLHRRWQAGGAAITLLPCELVVRNGDMLRAAIHGLAQGQGREAAFLNWLERDCLWANTLVDRIVSEPLSPAGAVAEPYALWAIERQPGLILPFTHPDIVLTDNLDRYERLKLHILNLGHSWLAARWHAGGGAADQTVRVALADPDTRAALERVMAEEVLPGFAARGMADEARDYIATTLDRFANPFLDHRLADIFQGHAAKIEKRVGGFVRWVDSAGETVAMPELRALAAK